MKKVGVSLSGGGSRGIMHLGILKAFDEAGITISMITGASAGAIVGAFYCSGYSPDRVMDIIRETRLWKYVRPAMSFSGLLKFETIISVFRKYIKNDSFKSLNIPFVTVATNLNRGQSVYLSDGSLVQSVLASCAVPIIFRPIELNGELYIDGGILNNLPVEPLIGQCDLIIGFNCNPVSENYEPGNMRSILERTLLMTFSVNTYTKKDQCDIFMEPQQLKGFSGFDFAKGDEIFEIGYEYGRSRTEEILELLIDG